MTHDQVKNSFFAYFLKILVCGIVVLGFDVHGKPILKKSAAKTEQISVKMKATGDLNGEYIFTGPLGQEILSTSNGNALICEISSLFRKLNYRDQKSIESWMSLICNFEGQKKTFRTHRFYLNIFLKPGEASQKIKLPMLDKKLKNVQLEFSDLSLKLSK